MIVVNSDSELFGPLKLGNTIMTLGKGVHKMRPRVSQHLRVL
jgi:Sec-independent protein translocase protein TatA